MLWQAAGGEREPRARRTRPDGEDPDDPFEINEEVEEGGYPGPTLDTTEFRNQRDEP